MSEHVVTITIRGVRGDYVAVNDDGTVFGHGPTPALAVRDWERELSHACGWLMIEKPLANAAMRRRIKKLKLLTRGRP